MTGIKRVAVAGAGRIGLPIVLELHKTGYQVTVLTRDTAHLMKIPSDIDIKQVDYDSDSSLTEALKGQDALISTVAMSAISNQPRMIDAAIAAEVKVFVPAEYTVNSRDALAQAQPMMSSVVGIQKYLATKEDQITWFVINCGALLEFVFDHPVLLDFDNRKATLWDGGEGAISLSNFGLLARAVTAVLKSPTRVHNHRLMVHGGTITQNRALEIAKEYSAQPWTAEHADSQAAYSASMKSLSDGSASTLEQLMGAMLTAYNSASFGRCDCHFESAYTEPDNAWLGVAKILPCRDRGSYKDQSHGELAW
ncbi:hypothetical protein LTR78_006177 [Recurvomyces mirabilis]|uniref:NmrA-like domain-containing protein n=1 Tax=Recurvomyces mirabilis TaxID=574656 RepID=A0AAE1C0K8_9PEZI|nr:hypothetical protein LTR78_006177 [Recurvomyces mirabilis]KAK5152019.1 hypothetical protein LTS14_008793 [Recurvomyces mirabilis]